MVRSTSSCTHARAQLLRTFLEFNADEHGTLLVGGGAQRAEGSGAGGGLWLLVVCGCVRCQCVLYGLHWLLPQACQHTPVELVFLPELQTSVQLLSVHLLRYCCCFHGCDGV